jgi:uncharacterized membrane protein YcaP (DUF421 family)
VNVDLGSLFLPDTPPLEIFIRGSITYLALFLLLRLSRRQHGTLNVADILLIVLIADAAQNAMAGSYTSITDGLLLVATIAGWALALDWLGYRFGFVERLVHPAPLTLIENGKVLRRNMRRELVTMDELMSHLREQGIDDVSRVKRAYVEGDGNISVIEKDGQRPKGGSGAIPGAG